MKTLLTTFALMITAIFYSCNSVQVENRPVRKHGVDQKKAVAAPHTIENDTLKIAAVGDIMLGTSYPNNYTLPPDSAKESFINAEKDLRSADVTVGNLEGTLIDTAEPAPYKIQSKTKSFFFKMPVCYAGVLKNAGFKVLSLANNHIGDFGSKGRTSTMKVLDSMGINYGGQTKHPYSIFNIRGTWFGFCAFAPNSHTLSILDLKKAHKIIQTLKQQCEVVIVSFHGGGEGPQFEHVPFKMESYINEKRGDVHAFAHNAIDAGADLVFGNGPHVCRAIELYNNRLIAYSLGNFCTYRSVSVAGACGFSPLLKVKINRNGEFLSGMIQAYKQTHDKGLVPDSLNHVIVRIKDLTEKDFPQNGITISDDGVIAKN